MTTSPPAASTIPPLQPVPPAPPPSRLGRWGTWLRRFSRRPWFLPAAAGVSAADFFLPVLPTQTLLIAAVLLHPNRWLRTALYFVAGGVLGGALLAAAVGAWGPIVVETIVGGAMQTAGWERVSSLVQAHGAIALAVLAMIPWPMRTGVAICALLGVPFWETVAALVIGRGIAFPGFAFLLSRSPAWLMRRAYFSRLREEVRALEADAPASLSAPSRPGIALVLLALGLSAFALELSADTVRLGEARPDDARTLRIVETLTPQAVTREFFLPNGTLAVREQAIFAADPKRGVVRIEHLDTRSGLRLNIEEQAGQRGVRLEHAGKVEERVEPANEPLVTAGSLPVWFAASRAELVAGRAITARFPITKAGKTLRVVARWRALADGTAELTVRPTNPLFGILADSLVLTFDAEGRVWKQSGLCEVLGGTAAKPGLQSGMLLFQP